MDINQILHDEIVNDPVSMGYAAMKSSDALANALNDKTKRTKSVAKAIKASDLFAMVSGGQISQASFAACFAHPRFTDFLSSIDQNNVVGAVTWANAFAFAGTITSAEKDLIVAYLTGTDTINVSRAAELGLPEVGRGMLIASGAIDEFFDVPVGKWMVKVKNMSTNLYGLHSVWDTQSQAENAAVIAGSLEAAEKNKDSRRPTMLFSAEVKS